VSERIAEARPAESARPAGVVVVVEDDDSLRVALVRLLRARGFETRAYATGEAALVDCDLEGYDCLLVDLNLPAMSGLELVDRLRDRGVTAAVVAMTARDEPSLRDDAKRRGAEHFLAKPFLGRELVALLDSIVGRPPRTRRRGG
jgi:FixJ family two-component response regulator